MINWILSIFEKSRVRSKSTLPFIMFNTAKKYMQGHLMYIYENLDSKIQDCRKLQLEYTNLSNKETECYYSKDKFGVVTKLSSPLVTHDLLSKYTALYWKHIFSLVAFVFLEGAFFYLIAENLAGPLADLFSTNPKVKQFVLMIISLLFAIVCAFVLDLGLNYFIDFQKARVYYQENKIRKEVMHREYFNLCMGIVCFLGFIAAIVTINLARNYALDSPAAMQLAQNSGTAALINPYLGWCLIAVSLVIAIYIALVKLDLSELAPRMSQYKLWKSICKSMEENQKKFEKLYSKIENQINIEFLSVKQMLRDLREILGGEIDNRDEELLAEYRTLRLSTLKPDAEIYRKYERLVTCMDELVDYGMWADIYAYESYIEIKKIRAEVEVNQKLRAERLTPPNTPNYIYEGQNTPSSN